MSSVDDWRTAAAPHDPCNTAAEGDTRLADADVGSQVD
jgi:hypothetical protein